MAKDAASELTLEQVLREAGPYFTSGAPLTSDHVTKNLCFVYCKPGEGVPDDAKGRDDNLIAGHIGPVDAQP